jgi:hypothetical protein
MTFQTSRRALVLGAAGSALALPHAACGHRPSPRGRSPSSCPGRPAAAPTATTGRWPRSPARPRPADRDPERARRRRHHRARQHGPERPARRLHGVAVPDGHDPPAAHAEGGLAPDQRLQLHHRRSPATPSASWCAADSPYKTFKDYIEAARKEPGKINYGSTGTGTSPHLLMEEVADAAKVELNHVPFKGNADQMQALLGGHVMAASDATGWDKFVDAGQMRLLVTFGDSAPSAGPTCPPPRTWATTWWPTRPTAWSGPRAWTRRLVKTCTTPSRRPSTTRRMPPSWTS